MESSAQYVFFSHHVRLKGSSWAKVEKTCFQSSSDLHLWNVSLSLDFKCYEGKNFNVLLSLITAAATVRLMILTSAFIELLDGSDGKESACSAGDPGSGRSPGEGKGYLLQYSCVVKLMDRRAQWSIIHRVTKSQTQLSN